MVELDGLYEALREYHEREWDTPFSREEFDHDIFLEKEKGIPIGICYSSMNAHNEEKFGDDEHDVQVNLDTENLNAYVEIPEEFEEYTDKKKVVIYQFDDDQEMIDFINEAVFEDWYEEGCYAIRKAIGDVAYV
jgi:hypothetical protein